MNILYQKLKRWILPGLIGTALLFLLLSAIFVRLAIAYHQVPLPQAILTLGGSSVRIEFTAQFAQVHPSLEVWVSSGVPPYEACPIFRAADIPASRVHLDYQAVDTVTNFTALVDDFKRLQIRGSIGCSMLMYNILRESADGASTNSTTKFTRNCS